MRRIAVITAALTALCGGAVSVHAADTPGTDLPVAKLVACDMTSPDRSAVFYGRMPQLPGATGMAMRFIVLQRLGRDDTWSKVDVPALRQWHRAAPGVKAFGYKQTVDNLRAGGAYKARIQFRWTTASGTVLDSVKRDTAVCRGQLANLAVGSLTVGRGPTPDTRNYNVTVQNTGKADADAIEVVLSVDHAVLDAATIDSLDAGQSVNVSFTGPPCVHAVRIRVDPDNTIGETSEDDNSRLFSCP